MKCYFCREEITGPVEYHHPDRANHPDWTVPAHPACHNQYHTQAGHFKFWGTQSPFAGRPGYEKCIEKWPGFHHMGGLARAKSARRDEHGRFI